MQLVKAVRIRIISNTHTHKKLFTTSKVTKKKNKTNHHLDGQIREKENSKGGNHAMPTLINGNRCVSK